MAHRRQHLNAQFSRKMSGIARQATLHGEERLGAQRHCIGKQPTVFLANIAEPWLGESLS